MEISAALWAVRLGKDFTFYVFYLSLTPSFEGNLCTQEHEILS